MTFDEIPGQVIQLLQRQGRVSYRALKRRFNLDDEYLEDLKAELIKAQHVAVDEDGEVLVWTGSPRRSPTPGGKVSHSLGLPYPGGPDDQAGGGWQDPATGCGPADRGHDRWRAVVLPSIDPQTS
jgi:hypothetical protein